VCPPFGGVILTLPDALTSAYRPIGRRFRPAAGTMVVVKIFKAIVWPRDDEPGIRTTYLAETVADAEKQLHTEYGEDIVFTMHNEEDAERLRD
jgi:hypothetical protein